MDGPGRSRRVAAGRLIRAAREAKGWTAKELAEMITAQLKEETVGQPAVSYWESGRNAPRWDKHRAIEKALDLEPGVLNAVLLGESPPRRPTPTEAEDDPQFSLLSGAWSDLSEEDRQYVAEMAQRLRRHDG